MGNDIRNGKSSARISSNNNPAQIFLKTFLIAFVIFVILCTPGLAMFGKVADYNPFDPEGEKVVLEEELPVLVDENSPFFEAFQDKKRVNVLLLGVNDGLTDTIMLVSFDMEAKHVDLISIPRDTYYHREGYNGDAENKINAAYRNNPLNTAKAVSEILLGMPINYYAVVDYEGIKNIVDSMGGVPMNIPFHMRYSDPYDKPPLEIDLPAGYQVLNGDKAVQFLRFRKGSPGYKSYPEGDIGRVKAQQEFVKSAFRQALGLSLPKVVSTTLENVDSDIPLGMAAKLAAKAAGLSGEDIQTYTIPGKSGNKKGLSFWLPDEKGIEELIMQIYGVQPETPEPEQETGGAGTE